MSDEETIIGTSKVDPRYRITLVKPIPELLSLKVGDLTVFFRCKNGDIIIRSSRLPTPNPVSKRKRT